MRVIVVGVELVANVYSADKSISRRLLYFPMFNYAIGSYRIGRANQLGVCAYSTKQALLQLSLPFSLNAVSVLSITNRRPL